MQKKDLYFEYPEELVATAPSKESRVLWTEWSASSLLSHEITKSELLSKISAKDILVINNTRVIPRRLWVQDEKKQKVPILFLDFNEGSWQVLFPARDYELGARFLLPKGIGAELMAKGLPQTLKVHEELSTSYFNEFGEMPLPPYILNARLKNPNSLFDAQDAAWYQTAWAREAGSFAAPTASLHFTKDDVAALKQRGVKVVELTLHVGLGTFLPVKVNDLSEHLMHQEEVKMLAQDYQQLLNAKKEGARVWAMGTTVVRALESISLGKLAKDGDFYCGSTDLLIMPPFEFKVVDVLMTNFHQPESTLLALVAAFAGLDRVKRVYRQAIRDRFRLFSYGDLTVWNKN